ncbi:MAG: hypothetical protein ABIY70_14725 [Capsulimonas sp.]|uniref:hypothetical protein n=1 Tax=Capsulimonas sp. TaxID=2494211 RepID=UPI003266DF9C
MALSEEDRERILLRDDLGPVDRWVIEECYSFQDSHIHMTHKLLGRYVDNQPVGDWMSTAGLAMHEGTHAIAMIAMTVIPTSETSYWHKIYAASLLMLLSDWSSLVRYDIENIKLLLDPPETYDISLSYVKFVGIILNHPQIWTKLKPEVQANIRRSCERLELPEPASLKTKRECHKALKSILEDWRRRNKV